LLDLNVRDSIKQALFARLPEERDSRVAAQISDLLAKIARYDWPQQWSGLFLEIIKLLESNNPLLVYRGLMFLNDVLGELVSRRLASDKKEFQTGACSFIGYVYQVWLSEIQRIISFFSVPPTAPEFEFVLDLALLSTKCMQELIIEGIPDLDESPDARKFFQSIHEVLNSFVPAGVLALQKSPKLMVKFEQLVFALAEVVVKTEEQHTVGFRVFLVPFLELFYSQLVAVSDLLNSLESLVLEDYIVISISFLKSSLQHKHRRVGASFSALRGIKFDPVAAQELENAIAQFFNQQFVVQMTQLLVERFVPLHATDLALWNEDQERFFLDSQMALQKEKVRPAAQSLFLTLLSKYRDIVGDVCLSYFEKAVTTQIATADQGDILQQKILFKECIYSLMGIGCFDFHEKLNAANFSFGEFLKQILLPELNASTMRQETLFKVLRARIAVLIGEWYAMDPVAKSEKPAVYSLLVDLSKDSDLVVSLNAISALKLLIDSDDFSPEVFFGYEIDFINTSLKTLQESTEMDVRSFILETISIFFEKMGERVIPVTKMIVEYLPYLWEMTADQNVLRGSLIQLVCNLVKSLGPKVRELEDFIVGVLGVALNPNIEGK
jgi:hypothetical protein